MLLSGPLSHPCDSVELEQYATDGDLAARWLADIAAFGDLSEGCKVADLGAGNGVLGLGALAMGAGRAILVEADEAACDVAKSNAESMGFADSVEVICATHDHAVSAYGADGVRRFRVDILAEEPRRSAPNSIGALRYENGEAGLLVGTFKTFEYRSEPLHASQAGQGDSRVDPDTLVCMEQERPQRNGRLDLAARSRCGDKRLEGPGVLFEGQSRDHPGELA